MEEAVEAVIRGDQKTLVERRDQAIAYFNKMGVQTERVLKALEVNHLDDITLDHLVDLGGMRAALKTGESTLDQLFPEERAAGPTPETLEEKLKAISKVDPVTGEIKEAVQDAAVTGQGFVKDGRRVALEDVLQSGAASVLRRMGREPLFRPPARRLPFPLRPQRTTGTRTLIRHRVRRAPCANLRSR